MSLVSRYKLNNINTLLDDDTGSFDFNTNINGVSVVTDATYGPVAYFDDGFDQHLQMSSTHPATLGASPHTFSIWVKLVTVNGTNMVYTHDEPPDYRFQISNARAMVIGGGTLSAFITSAESMEWSHYVITYNGNSQKIYRQGVLIASLTTTLDRPSGVFQLGRGSASMHGLVTDFRIYDDDLSASQILAVYNDGPNPKDMYLTIYTHLADLSWDVVTGASSYTITSSRNSGTEDTLITTSDLSHEVFDLVPSSSYEFKVYSDLDLVTSAYEITESALTLNFTNVDLLMVRISNDLTLLNQASVSDVSPFLNNVLTTGEILTTDLGKYTFVQNSGALTISAPMENIFTAFDGTSGSTQNISITLPDTSVNLIEYDEVNNEVVYNSTNYDAGDYFVVGTHKVTIKEL